MYLVLNLLTHLIDSLTIIQCRQMRCTEIRCHNDERIAEINRAPLPVCQSPVIKHLQQHIENIRMRFFYLIKQNNLKRSLSD